jgi:hypothetical protein
VAMVIKFTVMWRHLVWYVGSIFRVEIYIDDEASTLLRNVRNDL